jgi:uncharacterized membrane protein
MDTNSIYKNKNIPIIMLSCGISIGTGLGITLGVVFDNIPVGLSIGAGAGISMGMVLYQYFSSRTCNKK